VAQDGGADVRCKGPGEGVKRTTKKKVPSGEKEKWKWNVRNLNELELIMKIFKV
jgi:hypothetical protein